MYIIIECSIIGLTRRRRLVKMDLFVARGSLPVGKRKQL
jgi:hypothetical protein